MKLSRTAIGTDKQKLEARRFAMAAVKVGALYRPWECDICGKIGKPQGHHDDYEKPLVVRWLCQKCHSRIHVIVRRAKRAQS